MRTIEVTPERVAEGKKLYSERCAPCHDNEGIGRTGVAPKLNSPTFLAAASDAFLIRTITYGRYGTAMIPWQAMLTPEQRDAIVAYMRSWGPTDAAKLDESELKGDVTRGSAVYVDICVGCHGPIGSGYLETANGTAIGRKSFLDAATNGFLRHVIREGKSLTKMRPFAIDSGVALANLTDQEIDDVIAFLRSRAW